MGVTILLSPISEIVSTLIVIGGYAIMCVPRPTLENLTYFLFEKSSLERVVPIPATDNLNLFASKTFT